MLGARLKQARQISGMTLENLAQVFTNNGYAITKQAISNYERNQSSPPAPFLLLASTILNVPPGYLTHQPAIEVEWIAFRKHSQLRKSEQEMVKAYSADIAELQLELQMLLFPHQNVDFPHARKVASFEEAEALAKELREVWGLDNHPIDSLVQMAEDHQIIVIGWDQNKGQFDGLSGWCNQHPIIVINTAVDVDRQRFNLAHELGHLLMDTHDVTDKQAEQFAHRFAAALLVPAERAIHELGTRRIHLDWEELGILKRKYGLSMAAWIYRAKDLDIITDHYATTLYRTMSQYGWRKQEPVDFIADEAPLKLEQMAHHAVAEGLMSSDRIRRVYPDWFEREQDPMSPKQLTVYDLLNMPEAERTQAIERSFDLASAEEFEMFDADDLYETDGTIL